MYTTIKLSICLIIFLGSSSIAQTCNNLPQQFSSFSQAERLIKASRFLMEDYIDCRKSSWVHSAKFLSCDGKTGYFIFRTKKSRVYYFQNIPISLWNRFKNASSYGDFFNTYIKDRYQLKIK